MTDRREGQISEVAEPAPAGMLERRTQNRGRSPVGRWFARRLLESIGDPPIMLRLWDGTEVFSGSKEPTAVVQIRRRSALQRLLVDPEFEFGELYSSGDVEVEGDLVSTLEAIYRGFSAIRARRRSLPMRGRRRASNGHERASENIHHHYDIGNDFYRLWLDEQLVYTCAYFPDPETGLEAAQTAKLDYVCRKLDLRPGERVAEAGCGWGALALHMARHYGVSVQAFNLSTEQVAFARERARAEGLDGRVRFVQDDYRNIAGQFDAFVSVGMLEHVGTEYYGTLGQVMDRVLTPDGRGLIHSIGRDRAAPMNAWIERRIFPGAHPPSLGEMMEVFEPNGFSVLDVENLRLHYARTLDHWLQRYDKVFDEVERRFDHEFARAWRLYLAGSQAAFLSGDLQLFQVVFARSGHNLLPWTRERLYDRPLRGVPA